ncbi:paraneoplastic antigen-like protein 8A [Echinops telfairi]|uniref:Paraneoplastic antigen-like protein 8A n=1 Tax=Echinops telfairi TaxID=9371 RepID=A0ABM0IYB6_ECHTE|nr:paraneoplastic antigen-like protein 8A [Echinops telfairi]
MAAVMTLLEDWCRGMDLDIHRALLVTGIPQDCGQVEIEETLRVFFTPLGPYQVVNKIFVREDNAKAVLIEMGEGVNLSTLPREVPGRGGTWRVVCRDPTQDAEFLKNLHDFLESEGRTVEDVVRLLELSSGPPRAAAAARNLPQENWAEALGVLLGTVVQVVFHMDAEIRHREEARALEMAEAEAEMAAWAAEAGRRVKKESGSAPGAACALKAENPSGWYNGAPQGPRPVAPKARAKNSPRKKKQSKAPKQEPMFWKKPKGGLANGAACAQEAEAPEAEGMETSECTRASKKAPVKQEEATPKKPGAKCARKVRRDPPQGAPAEAESLGGVSEPDQDGSQEVPPKKKAMGCGAAKKVAPMKKKKKVSLGPVSYVLVDPEEAKKPPMSPEKGLGARKDVAVQKGPNDPEPDPEPAPAPTSGSQDPEAEGSPQTSNGQSDRKNHLECVAKWMMWEEQEWEVEEEPPKGEEAVGPLEEGGHSAPEGEEEEEEEVVAEAADATGKVPEAENPFLPPGNP